MFRKRVLSAVWLLLCLSSLPWSAVNAQETSPFPVPTGTYAVGSAWRHWVDESREETYDEAPHGDREMMVKILYPAMPDADAAPEVYMPERDILLPFFADFITSVIGAPTTWEATEFDPFQTHTFLGAPLADDQPTYPVLIFSHGANAEATMYTSLLEELASYGYIVVAIDHAYGAAATIFPDGRVIYPNFAEGLEGAAPIWAQDQIFVMDQLEALNTDDPDGQFTGRLDLERIGVLGHSVGGATATTTCFLDARCKAGVNLDGPVYGDVIEQGLDQPFLYLLSDSRVFADPAFYAEARGPYYEADFNGFEHLDFADFPLWPHMEATREVGWLGSVEPMRAVEVTNAYVLAFFDHTLKGEDETLLEGASAEYPEVTLTGRNTSSS